MERIIDSKVILKDLHSVLMDAQRRFTEEYIIQEVKLNDNFKIAFRNYLSTKNCSAEFFEFTTVITNTYGQQIYIANQWFVIASYFVDFCSEMMSYQDLFEKICRRQGMGNKRMKEYATHLKSSASSSDKNLFISVALDILYEDFADVDDNKDKIAEYLWRFASEYAWWSGSKTIDRHDFFVSALLNQMNVVNANSEYLAFITQAYASVLKLRLMVDDVEDFTIGLRIKKINATTREERDNFVAERDYSYQPVERPATKGISISAASLERFKAE